MSKFEIILIVLACAVPIMALIFVAPKFKKKEKKKEAAPIKTYEEMKKISKIMCHIISTVFLP